MIRLKSDEDIRTILGPLGFSLCGFINIFQSLFLFQGLPLLHLRICLFMGRFFSYFLPPLYQLLMLPIASLCYPNETRLKFTLFLINWLGRLGLGPICFKPKVSHCNTVCIVKVLCYWLGIFYTGLSQPLGIINPQLSPITCNALPNNLG